MQLVWTTILLLLYAEKKALQMERVEHAENKTLHIA